MSNTRTERDSLGSVELPIDALYGAQTHRAIENFPISGIPLPPRLIRSFALLKHSAALENKVRGTLDAKVADAIAEAAQEVMDGQHLDAFPVDVFQTGSGTSTNMNVNEVLSNRANVILGGKPGDKAPVHPNDHVNMSQSSNDTFPTAMHVAALVAVNEDLLPGIDALLQSLDAKVLEFDEVVKVGRTHLMDAVPVRLGQEFSGYASLVRDARKRIVAAAEEVAQLPLGGTAVGTGLNAPAGWAQGVIARMAEKSGLPVVQAENLFAGLSAKDALVGLSSAVRSLAVSMTKIANDVRWLGSGPHCGIGEIKLPSLQPGSSIMPGKVNPVIPESMLMTCAQVMGNDATVAFGGSQGNFELNVMMPVIALNVLQSVEIMGNGCRVFAEKCVDGLEADVERCRELVEQSLVLITALNPVIGYDKAAAIVKESLKSGRTLREVAKEHDLMPEDELERLLEPKSMT